LCGNVTHRIAHVSTLLCLRGVLPACLQHDTIMDQKAPYYPPVLHLLPQTAGYLTLEGVDLRGVVLPVAPKVALTAQDARRAASKMV